MPAGIGANASLRVKREAVAGTRPTTGFRVVPVTGFELVPKLGSRVLSKVLGSAYAATNTAFRSPIATEGSCSAEGGYNGSLDWMLDIMLGTKATTGGGADPYTNIYSPSSSPPTYHAEYNAGGIPTGKGYRYQNVIGTELALSGDSSGNIEARLSLMAEKEASATGGDTLTSAGLVSLSDVPINNDDATAWNLGVGADTLYCVRKWGITLRRPTAPPRGCLGSTIYKAPLFSGPLEVSYDWEIEWEDEAMYRAFLAGTVLTAIKTRYVGPALRTGFYTFEARVNRSDLDEAGPPPWRDNGALVSVVRGTGYGNAGSGAATEPVAFTLINDVDGAVL